MTAHEEMLIAARTIVKNKSIKEFSPSEIYDVLKKSGSIYKKSTVYAEMLRCCRNCPREGESTHDYFVRIKKGKYKLIDNPKK